VTSLYALQQGNRPRGTGTVAGGESVHPHSLPAVGV
jgi:hypothetical protein